jgi:DNA-binding IclR family transcriptional regulator
MANIVGKTGAPVNEDESRTRAAAKPRGVDSVGVAGQILQACLRLEHTFRLKDLAEATALPAPTLYRYLVSLCEVGLLQRVPGGTRYTLGLLAYQLGQRATRSNDLLTILSPQIQAFSERIGETCAIGLWFEGGATIVRWFEVNGAISISLRLNSELPLLVSSTAQVFAAFLPREQTEPILLDELRRADRPRSDADEFYRSLAKVRQRKLAQGLGKHIRGISSLSAPVFGAGGELVAAIAVIGNQLTFDATLNGPIAGELTAFCDALGAQLGAAA